MWKEDRRSCDYFTTRHRDGPIPPREFVEPVDGMVADAGHHVDERSLRIDVVELGRL